MKKINVFQTAFVLPYITLISINLATAFKCGTDELKIEPIPISVPKEVQKRRAANEFTPIKIKADYTSFTRTGSMTSETLEKAKQLIDATISEFNKLLKIQHENIDLKGSEDIFKKGCKVNQFPSDFDNILIENDLVIFPSFHGNLSSNVLAAATYCIYDTKTYRPYAGILYINPSISFDKKNTDIYMKQILLHEMTHILVFHPGLFEKWGLMKKINDIYYINSPNALSKAKQHFNCDSLTGIPLENQGDKGSAGSHWEARYMLTDYMMSTNYVEPTISDITLALFEDSGIYQVNYYTGGLFKFGKNKGCAFFNRKCLYGGTTSFPDEFCTNFNQDSWTNARTNKGSCLIYKYNTEVPEEYRYFTNPKYGGFYPADYCPVTAVDSNLKKNDYLPTSCKYGTSSLSDYGEIIGETSFCFNSSLLPSSSTLEQKYRSICYEVECDNTNKQIIIKYGSSSVKCPTSGGSLNPSGFKGNVICPKYYDICSSGDNKLCNDLFDCIDKKATTDQSSYSYIPGQKDDEKYIEPVSDDDNGDNDDIPIYRGGDSCLKYNYNLFLLILLLTFI